MDAGLGKTEILSVVMPAFNEESTLEQIVTRVLAQPQVGQLIIVDDASSDGTPQILLKIGQNPKVEIITHPRNMGKGAAIKSASQNIKFPYVLIQDADLEYDPTQYSKILAPLISGHADVVYGSRFQTGEVRRVLYFWHFLGNQFLTLLSNAFTNLNLSDMETCFKAMKSSHFQNLDLKEKRFGVEPEMTAKLAAKKLRFFEVSISYFGRTYEEGKKIHAKDGFRAIFCIVFYNLPGQKKKSRKLQ
ncbi:glycosyltransferase [Candidatus Planktophila dulcis]|uniref:glycosyltransferase family 2 protein n=1 Tax=Candidatus Planktophila dulcis TaxID=1884914 RepID=UPI000BACE655|nr:glycosyltransferase family 2 protein [Candidatus Planktophila dulcis]ASY21809.1 glycosyltransferase [Candidatus Planktophila dulcis]